MFIKDNQFFKDFDDFERRAIAVASALTVDNIEINQPLPCRMVRFNWHCGITFLSGSNVDIFVDSEDVELISDDAQAAVDVWMGFFGEPRGGNIPAEVYAMRENRWATGT